LFRRFAKTLLQRSDFAIRLLLRRFRAQSPRIRRKERYVRAVQVRDERFDALQVRDGALP
jgi:hypothetical protein